MGVGERKRCAGCTPACCRICAGFSLALGVLLLLVGMWATSLRKRFTPVYREIACRIEPATVDRVWFDHGMVGMHMKIVTRTTCTNPNPYAVAIRSSGPGQVYMGQDMTPVGSVVEIPEATLPAGGSGSIEADLVVTPTARVIGSVLDLFFSGNTPIYLENNLAVHVDVKFFLGSFSTSRAFNKDCGMMLKMTGFLEAMVGPMACADTWDSLKVPDFSADPTVPDEMAFSADHVGGDEIDQATHLKDLGTGMAMGVGYGLGGLLVLCGSLGLLASCCSRRRRAVPVKVDEGNAQIEAPPVDEAASAPQLVEEV